MSIREYLVDRLGSHGKSIAIVDKDGSWSWSDLRRKVTYYARRINEGDPSGNLGIIPIIVGRNVETIAAMFSVIVSGRAFAPISENLAVSEIELRLDELGATFLICCSDTFECANRLVSIPIVLPALESDLDGADEFHFESTSSQSSVLYCLFTSGSTGRPKAVLISDSNIENTIFWSLSYLDWKVDDVIGCVTNFYFDISMFDVFTMVVTGTPLAIISNPKDIFSTKAEVSKFKVTSLFSVPTFFMDLRTSVNSFSEISCLRRIISGGDFYPPAELLKWFHYPEILFFNVWGPTETSVVNTMYLATKADIPQLSSGSCLPVGESTAEMQFVILDESSVPVGPGSIGEICMLGDSVGIGYLNADSGVGGFCDFGGERAFKTGDLGWVDECGFLYIHGRVDSVVKIRGHRVDLAGLDRAAVLHPSALNAVSFVGEINGHDILCLAIHEDETGSGSIYGWKKFLREKLPDYMVPKLLFFLDRIPTTPNGKISRTFLRDILR